MSMNKKIKRVFEKQFKCKLTNEETTDLVNYSQSGKTQQEIELKVLEIIERKK